MYDLEKESLLTASVLLRDVELRYNWCYEKFIQMKTIQIWLGADFLFLSNTKLKEATMHDLSKIYFRLINQKE